MVGGLMGWAHESLPHNPLWPHEVLAEHIVYVECSRSDVE